MSEQSAPSIEKTKKVYEQLAFIHQVLTQRTQYFLDEVDVAKDAARTVTDMANKLSDEIRAKDVKPEEAAQETPEVSKES